ncbi:DUF1097 domain-containing protein [Streptomyces sp. ARC32]
MCPVPVAASNAATPETRHSSGGRGVRFTLISAVTAAVAAFLVAAAGLPPWAMFVGWVTWFLRPTAVRQGAHSVACLWAGMALGMAAQFLIGLLAPTVGPAALPVTVVVVASIVVGLRSTPVLDTPLAWFLGLISTFALHADEPLSGLLALAAASAVGAAAALACQWLQRQFSS